MDLFAFIWVLPLSNQWRVEVMLWLHALNNFSRKHGKMQQQTAAAAT
jgi:hypothetical protein